MERVREPATIARIGGSARENKLRRYPMESSLETWKCKYDIIPLNARGFILEGTVCLEIEGTALR